jgi:RHS repeat-associated protein
MSSADPPPTPTTPIPLNHTSAVLYPGGTSESFRYDDVGRLKARTDRNNQITTNEYDALGRLTRQSVSDGLSSRVLTYDPGGRLASVANGEETLSWTYDAAGGVLSERSTRSGQTVGYSYDGRGRRASLALNGSALVTYGYDDDSRLTSLSGLGASLSFAYDTLHRRTSLLRAGGSATSYTYDALSRLSQIGVSQGASPLWSAGYSYDAADNRLTKTLPELAESYTYDAVSRLVGVGRTGSSSRSSLFGYDAVGNRTSEQEGTNALGASFNERNQLLGTTLGGPLVVRGALSEPGTVTVNGAPARALPGNGFEGTIQALAGTNTFTVEATDLSGNVTTNRYSVEVAGTPASFEYDSNGNLTQKTEGGSVWSYEWNGWNQLVGVVKDGAEVARFTYDPLGRRVGKVAGGVTTSWAYDGADIVQETVNGGTASAATYRYLHGPGIDEPLARQNVGTGAIEYYHADGLGSIVKMTDAAGSVTQSRQYDAWGNLELGADQPGYAFTGREWDPETGLYYYRARYYEPKIGRFISEDPIGFVAGLNFYGYVRNRPTGSRDPSGLWSPGAHNALFVGAFSGRLSQEDIDLLASESRLFDLYTQSSADAYKHAMRADGDSEAVGRIRTQGFIYDTLNQARCAAGAGQNYEAMLLLAHALHTIQDGWSPEHVDREGNPRKWNWWARVQTVLGVGHSPADFLGQEGPDNVTPAIQAGLSRQMNAAYDYVFRTGDIRGVLR